MTIVKGQVRMEFVDVRSGLQTREPLTFYNQITEHFYADLVSLTPATNPLAAIKSGSLLARDNRIGVSNNSTPAIAGQYTVIGNIKGSSVTLCQTKNHPNVDNFPWTNRPTESPPYTEIFNVLPYPETTTRTFQTVFLARSASIADSIAVYAYVVAPEPIVQGNYEIINLYYKIINASEDRLDLVTPSLDRDILNSLFAESNSTGVGSTTFSNPELVSFPVPAQDYKYLRTTGVITTGGTDIYKATRLANHFTHLINLTIPPRDPSLYYDFVGRIINSVGVGVNTTTNSYYQIQKFEIPALSSRYQGYFPHNASATTPFVDVSVTPKPASGRGLLNFGGLWTGTLPDYYQITITQTGSVGQARYKLQRKRHTGFVGNTYTSGKLRIPYINHFISTFQRFHGFNNSNFIRVSDDKVASWDADGLCIIDLRDGEYVIYDAGTGLNVTDITQITTDATITDINAGTNATKIWVGCRNTGLWEINLVNDTITQLVTDPCYAVDLGYQQKVFAVFGGVAPRLSNSDDFTTALTLNATPITSDWAGVRFIKCDPNSSVFEMLIKYGSGNTSLWWSTSSTAGITGPTIIASNQNSFDCSDTDSTWFGLTTGSLSGFSVHSVVKLTPSATSATTITTTQGTACAPNPCIIGNKLLVQYGTITTGNVGQAYSLHNTSNGALINRFDYIGSTWRSSLLTSNNNYLIYMGRTLTLYGSISENYADLVSAFNVSTYAFESYGWNGSSWVLGETGDKVTHSDEQPLLDGITISFVDAESGTSFVGTDYYDVYYCDGLLKSNTRTFNYDQYICYRERVSAAITADQNLTVPAAAPYTVKLPVATGGISPDLRFLVAYNLVGSLFEFKLNDVSATVNLSGQIPSAGQVTVSSDGTMTFNAADAGKLITSLRYSYLRR